MPAKKDDRWTCTRTEANGGKCEAGPLPDGSCAHPIPPCQPVRSLRKSRAMYVWLAALITAGGLLVLLGSQLRNSWLNPGELTNAHATSATKCSDCHSATPAGAAALVAATFTTTRNDSQLCLKCHQMGDLPLRAHGLSSARLAESTKRIAQPNEENTAPALLRASHSLALKNAHTDNLACATCHQEHHGRTFDLKRLSDAQCQACHTTQFASFEKGHPEFANYPYQRRTRIFFDHNSHLQQHFSEKKELAPAGCQSCHVAGPGGRFMQVKSFAASCAACHEPQIQGAGMTVKGVAFFTVPGIDAESLAANRLSIGEWPKFADAKLTPFMELLLDREPKARAAMEKLRGVDLLDLSKATPDQLVAAGEYAWAVKTLLFHIVVEGQPFLLEQLKDKVEPPGLEVPRAALLAAQKEWMPNLQKEIADYEKGIKPPLPERPAPTSPATSTKTGSGAAAKDQSLLVGDDLVASPAKPTATPGGDLLAGGNDDLVSATPASTPASNKSDDLTGGDLLDASVSSTPPPISPGSPAPEAIPAEQWVSAGGWYRPRDSFTLFYRPVGHADPFLVAWLTAAARLQSQSPSGDAHTALEKLSDPQSPGLCFKCHTTEASSAVTTVNWKPAQPDAAGRPFTTFDHSTHFSLVGDQGCQTCHTLNAKSEYPKFFTSQAGGDTPGAAMKFQSNFAPISKMLCAECHQPRVAGDGCIICHRYHAAPKAGKLAEIGTFHTAKIGKQPLVTEPAFGK
ncbi:MAG: hypothetical protein ABI946_00785 [Chthoniobacterales bacterium]